MRLKVEQAGEGLHPSEIVISINTRNGIDEEVFLSQSSLLQGGYIEVGWPVGRDGDYLLVELPRQTTRGLSRVWVHKDTLEEEERRRE